MIRLLLCDDHVLVREGLAHALNADPRFNVLAQAGSRVAVLDWLELDQAVDVVVLDLSLDSGGVPAGVDLIETLRAARPGLPIVVLSMHDDDSVVSAAMRAGARGYVTKDSGLHHLQEALVQVHSGHHFLAPRLVEPMLRRQQSASDSAWDAALTTREKDVFQLICAGRRLSEIAADWGVSIKTISTHKTRLMQKLGIDSNAALIRLGTRRGLG